MPERVSQIKITRLYKDIAAFLERAFTIGRPVKPAAGYPDPAAAVKRSFLVKALIFNNSHFLFLYFIKNLSARSFIHRYL